MFAGQCPFANCKDILVVIMVQQGMRPERPKDELAQTRGLTNDIWEIMKACWAQDAAHRPMAHEVVTQLLNLPGLPPDNRATDDFKFPSCP
jgi:hypothetical protein